MSAAVSARSIAAVSPTAISANVRLRMKRISSSPAVGGGVAAGVSGIGALRVFAGSGHVLAAVDRQVGAGHEGGGVAANDGDEGGDLVGVAAPAHRQDRKGVGEG